MDEYESTVERRNSLMATTQDLRYVFFSENYVIYEFKISKFLTKASEFHGNGK